jgi:methionyl-tRNA formyltransferase
MSEKFKIGYFADGIWAHEAMKRILDNQKIALQFVCGRYGTRDPILKKMAEDNNIDFLLEKNINCPDFLSKIRNYQCDLLVSMSFDQIFKNEIINLCPQKLINCHAGKLPFYRGRNILNWVLINGEQEFGITVHYVDEGIDTGDIIVQNTYQIGLDDDYGSLLNIAHKECASLLIEAISRIMNNKVERIRQKDVHEIGFYCGIRKSGDEYISWNQESINLFNFIRGLAKPGPSARSSINGVEIKINKASLIVNAPSYIGIPGQVVGKTKQSITVKTKDSTIEVIDYECSSVIKIGDRLS